jgi:PleD family two-component response regulator
MAARGRILVVDDEPHIRRILRFLLEEAGYEVETANGGEIGLTTVASFGPDLVILDVMMPQMDGFEVLRQLRADFETRQLPVVLLTAKGDSESKVRGLRDGANDYLTKPFHHEELLLRLHNMLEASRAQREANPLTGLPGNRAVEREIVTRNTAGAPFAVMYVDIDRFKGFNDHYGYRRGDEAIVYLARILRACSRDHGHAADFIGHIGGDDFVLVTASEVAEDLARRIVARFDEGSGELHDPVDLEHGYLEVENRAGELERIDLISLTIALIIDAQAHLHHPAELNDALAELKRYGKQQPGSVVVRERRSPRSVRELMTLTPEPDEHP